VFILVESYLFLSKIFQNFNISSKKMKLEKNKNQPMVGNDAIAVRKNDCPQSYKTPLNSSNQYLVNFTGLNRTLGKTAYENSESIKIEVANFPKSKGVVGNLPKEWIDKIPKSDREVKIKELYQDFNTIVKDLRTNMKPVEAADKFNKALHKAGVIEKNERLTLGQSKEGLAGWAFHMQGISDDKFILKVFKSNDLLNNYHGNYTELNRAAAWQKNAGKNTQMVRFYFGDADAGYMVNKFIDKEKTPICKEYVAPEIYGLSSNDTDEQDLVNGKNLINGFQIDYGGMFVLDRAFINNKKPPLELKNIFAAPVEERLELIKKAKTEVKQMLACQLNLLKEEERAPSFKSLAENSDNRMKKVLACKLYYLPEGERRGCFKLLVENSNNKVRALLAAVIDCLPFEERASHFRLFSENADDNLKKTLIRNICYLPKEERGSLFNKLGENANNETKKMLTKALYFLPDDEKSLCFKAMAATADIETKKNLADVLYCLPEDERVMFFKQFAETGGSELKLALLPNFHCIPDTHKASCFSHVAENADTVVKKELIRCFGMLAPSERTSSFKKLAENADEEVKKAMQPLVNRLPEADRGECLALVKVAGEANVPKGLLAFSQFFGNKR
jgi:hypothetical protein